MRIIQYGFVLFALMVLSACAKHQVLVRDEGVSFETKMSSTVLLDSFSSLPKTLSVSVQNDSAHSNINIIPQLKHLLSEREYKITDQPDQARYNLHILILQAGPVHPQHVHPLLESDFGGSLVALHLDASKENEESNGGKIYAMVADVEISEKITPKGIEQKSSTSLNRYQARIVSVARTNDQSFNEIEARLADQIAQEIAHLF